MQALFKLHSGMLQLPASVDIHSHAPASSSSHPPPLLAATNHLRAILRTHRRLFRGSRIYRSKLPGTQRIQLRWAARASIAPCRVHKGARLAQNLLESSILAWNL